MTYELLVIAWCAPLLLLSFSGGGKFFSLALLTTILARISIYFDGRLIGDIRNSYITTTENFSQFLYEPGYIYLIKAIKLFAINPNRIMYVTQVCVFLTILLIGLRLARKDNHTIIIIACILASGFTFLATQSTIRQGIAAPLILFFSYQFLNKRYVSAIILASLAQSFHFSSIVFIMVIISNMILKQFLWKRVSALNGKVIICVVIIMASIAAILSILFFDYIYIAGRNNDRFTDYTKPALVLIYFTITTILFMRLESNEIGSHDRIHFFQLRLIFYSIFLGLSVDTILVEVASRVLFFCYGLELYYLLMFKINRSSGKHLKVWVLINLIWTVNPSIYGLLLQKA